MNLHDHLLIDSDGDGLFDALRGEVYLSDSSSSSLLRAASEFIARLSSRAVRLHPSVSSWKTAQPALYIGTSPPEALPSLATGAELRIENGLLLRAAGDEVLLEAAQHFSCWPHVFGPDMLSLDAVSERLGVIPRALLYHDGYIGAVLEEEVAHPPRWADLPEGLAEVRTPAQRYTRLERRKVAKLVSEVAPPTHFSLARALLGGGLFTGAAEFPDTLTSTLHIGHPVIEAVAVAARLSTEGLSSKLPITGGREDSSIHLSLDKTLPPHVGEVRVATRGGSILEIAGGAPEGLSRAADLFARTFPALPDGTLLDEFEANLRVFLEGRTRLGRLAAVATHLSRSRETATRALLPSPYANAPGLLGKPVRNTLRDGERERWHATFPWEGDRFLGVLEEMDIERTPPSRVEAFLSERSRVREELKLRAKALLRARGFGTLVTIYSAYKPGLHWLLEEVAPQAAALGAVRVEISCARSSGGVEVSGRWLRELYPAADLVEKRYPGLKVSLTLTDAPTSTYTARAFGQGGMCLLDKSLSPPTEAKPYLGIPELGTVHPTTGGIKFYRGENLFRELTLPTDRDLAWDWFTSTVLPELGQRVVPGSSGPFFSDLTVNLLASEPDERLDIGHEVLSATESMHEDFYFGVLEGLNHTAGLESGTRSLMPGRILPFCRARSERETSVEILWRGMGTRRVGFEDNKGEFHAAPPLSCRVETVSLRLEEDGQTLHTRVHAESLEAARRVLARLRWLGEYDDDVSFSPLLAGLRLTFELVVRNTPVDKVEVPPFSAAPCPITLPNRSLNPEEVAAQARRVVERSPYLHAHLRPTRESVLGRPLTSLEMTSPGVPGASRVRLASWKPTVLVSARQHGNEPTSPNAGFVLVETLDPSLLKVFNIVFHPLENPDGAHLHHALCQHAPHHMHHAARYTSLGADLQTDPTLEGHLIGESDLRRDTWRRWTPCLHLNNHGYPAHEWVRAQSGYVPRNFEMWSLPFGYLTILTAASEAAASLPKVRSAVAEALSKHPDLKAFTKAQVERSLRYRSTETLPFTFAGGFPFLESTREDDKGEDTSSQTPWLTVITEVPDETVDGPLWEACVRAHFVINTATLTCLAASLQREREETVRRGGSSTVFTYRVHLT